MRVFLETHVKLISGLTQVLYSGSQVAHVYFCKRMHTACIISYIAKRKVLIRYAVIAVIAHLICTFVFTYAKSRFSHDVAHISDSNKKVYAVIWTTTPWSLPANQAVCYGKKIR